MEEEEVLLGGEEEVLLVGEEEVVWLEEEEAWLEEVMVALWGVEEVEEVVLLVEVLASVEPGWVEMVGNCRQDYLHFVLLLFCQQYAAKI